MKQVLTKLQKTELLTPAFLFHNFWKTTCMITSIKVLSKRGQKIVFF